MALKDTFIIALRLWKEDLLNFEYGIKVLKSLKVLDWWLREF